MTLRRLAMVFAAVTLVTPASALAAWAPNGNPLCTATGAQVAPSSASDGSGGMIVAWQDRRRGASLNDIYATRVLGDGTIAPGWPVDGVALTQSGIAGSPRAVPDGAGGALVLWLEASAIYAQRVTASGAIAPGFPATGKVVINTTIGFEAVSDAAGGAYILNVHLVFNAFASGFRPAAAILRIGPDAGTAAGWPDSGTSIGTTDIGIVTRLAAAPGGDCVYGVIIRVDGMTNPSFASAGRFHANGTREFRGLPQYPVTPFPGSNPGPNDVSVAPDGAGGIFALKQDTDGFHGGATELHGHHFDVAGNPSWPQSALVPFLHFIVSDGGTGLYGIGTIGSPSRLEANHFSSTGTPTWPVGSLILSQPTAFQTVRIAPLGLGNAAFACWSENPAGSGFDIKAAGVFPIGAVAPGSGLNGSPICNAAGNQFSPDFVLDGLGALACWEDQRSSVDGDIYANRVVLDMATAVQVSLASAEVTSDAVRLRWSVVDPNGAVTVLRRTRTDEWAAVGIATRSGGTLSFEDRDVVPGTEYGYAVTFAGDPMTRLGEHWVRIPAIAAALSGFVPNPASGSPRIAFALRSGERAQLQVVDLAGRVVMTRDVGSFGPGSHTIDLAGARLAAGVYIVRLTQGDQVHTARGVVVR